MRLNIYGDIVPNDDAWIYDYLEMDCTCPSRVAAALEDAKGQPVDVYINSGGGDIFAGSEIYSAIRSYTGQTTLHVVGLAASAASVIACAGRCFISPTAMMMVHNVSGTFGGDCHDMDKAAEVLRQANSAIAAAYVAKTGMTEEKALAMMDHETWITAKQAVDRKLVDGIEEEAKQPTQMVAAIGMALSAKTKQRIRDTVKSPAAQKAQAEIDILKLMNAAIGMAMSAEARQHIRDTVKSPAARKAQAEINILKLRGEHNETF